MKLRGKILVFLMISIFVLPLGFLLFKKPASAIYGFKGNYFALIGEVSRVNRATGRLSIAIEKTAGALRISALKSVSYFASGLTACKRGVPDKDNPDCTPVLISNVPLYLSEINSKDPIRVRGTVEIKDRKAIIHIIKIKLGYEIKEIEGQLEALEFRGVETPIIHFINPIDDSLLTFFILKNTRITYDDKAIDLIELDKLLQNPETSEELKGSTATITYFTKKIPIKDKTTGKWIKKNGEYVRAEVNFVAKIQIGMTTPEIPTF